jgi:hypothetical protein
MIQAITEALGVSPAVAWALMALGVVQLGVQVVALVDLVRRDRVMFDKKWIWALLIVLLSNLAIGAVVYFAVGRRVPQQVEEDERPGGRSEESRSASRERTQAAVDALYGEEEDR